MSQKKSFARKLAAVGAGAVLASAMFAAPSSAAEKIKLAAIDGYSPKSLWVKEFIDFYIPEIDKRLAKTGNYEIEWNQAWGQIVKVRGVLGGLQKGLGDIGVVTSVFHADKVPLQLVAYATPFVTNDPKLVAQTVDGLADKHAEFKQAFTKFNQVYLTNMAVLDTYQIFSKQPVARLADMNGLKIGSAGLNLRWLEGFGAAGVAGSLVHYYNQLSTGVLDAIMLWPEAVVGRKMYEVSPYMLKADLGTANSKVVSANLDTWKDLPDEVKTAIQEASILYRDHMADEALKLADSSLKAFVAGGGKVTELSQAERQEWADKMPNVAADWVAAREKEGLPGATVMKSYMNVMRANNQPILRQWDREIGS
ncbi:MAG: C4-dicarboxylate TRAP transporter substrate-binding protein [Alphaproteobacteria bacterium]